MTIRDWYNQLMAESVSLSYRAAVENIIDHAKALQTLERADRKTLQAMRLARYYYPKHWNAKVKL